MYAVIRDGSHQHIVRPGEVLKIERRDLPEGSPIEFKEVLLVADEEDVQVGTPIVENASVRATVTGEIKGQKLVIFKFKKRKDSRFKTGHRQKYTSIRIDEIVRSS